ncbi:MAG TPA: oxygenase MpaB family protein [Acidimicrobiales bacterium]|nr:oxygenase MpaB family protein [Acidimicrobiales bacterium]
MGPVLDPRAAVRALARAVEPGRGGEPAGAADVLDVDDPDPGWFGPDSAAWRLHGDAATVIAGFRALLLQALHPLVMAGVAQHSSFRHDPWGRLDRTARFLVATVYGGTADAERAVAVVRRVHRHVRGTAPDGRPYDAADAHLVTFVHVTEIDSFLAADRAYARRPLNRAEADRYCAEMAVVAERLGGEPAPRTAAATRAWLAERRPELGLGRDGRATVRFLLNPPVPLLARPAHAAVATAAVGLLPGWAQRSLLLPAVPPVDALVVRPGVNVLLATFHWAFPSGGSLADRRARAVAAGA